MSFYESDRITALGNTQAVLCGGGWTNRSREAFQALRLAIRMGSGQVRLLALPTPTSDPCNEHDLLRARLQKYPDMEFHSVGTGQIWPSTDEILTALAWANVLVVPGGNFTDYMKRDVNTEVATALKEAFLSGRMRVMGSSNGTVSWFDTVQTADLPACYGGGAGRKYWTTPGLGVIPGFVCAHYNERNEYTGIARSTVFQEMLKQQPDGTIGFGIDTPAAFVLDKGKFRVYTSNRYAHIQKIVVEGGGELRMTRLTQEDKPTPLDRLFAS